MTLLGGLEERGLVRRTRDPAHRRAYLVSATAAGEQVRARAARTLADCDDRFLAPLLPDERDDLRATLLRLL